MKSTNGGQGMDVEHPVIPENVAERLVMEKKAYAKAYSEFISNFDYDETTQYYLLSAKFLKEWKQYTAYDQKNLNQKPTRGTIPEQPYNINILETGSAGPPTLKPDLLEGRDYEILSASMLGVFKSYKGHQIQKRAIKLSNGKKIVEIYGLQFQYFFLSQKVVGDIDTKQRPELAIEKSSVSRYMTIKNFKKAIAKVYEGVYKKQSIKDIKIWKMNREMDARKYHALIKKQASPQRIESYKLKIAHAVLFDKLDSTIEDMAVANDDLLIIEVQQIGKQWVIAEGSNEDRCEFCHKYQILNVECGCKKVRYCSSQCRSRDLNFHRKKCDLADEEELKEEISFTFNKNSKNGICGLSNLGNTCFMNSCLQCLSNTVSLTEYFVSKRFVGQINKTNPIGTKGKLTIKYAKMIQALWCQGEDSYSPSVLKNAISDFQPMFSGYSQHDSQELLSFLLDGLHQDLNRVINKPYVQNADQKGEAEEVYAFESWKRYLMRNKSIIADIFMGQYKSKVVCPDCNFQSLTFDPYSTISVPIPQVTKVTLEAFVFYSNHRESTKKITVNASTKSLKVWKQEVAKSLSLDPSYISFYILSFDGECEQFTNDNNLERLISSSTYGKQEVFIVEHSKQEHVDIKNSVLIYSKFVRVFEDYSNRPHKEAVTFKRPFYWKFNKLTGQQVYHRIFTFLFKQSLSYYYKVSPNETQETINKWFEKVFDPSKTPFEIYLMSQPSKMGKQIKYQKELLIQRNTPVHELLLDNNGRLRKIEFEVRLKKDLKDELKKLNTFEDYEKYKKSKYEDEDNSEYNLSQCLKEFEKTEKLEAGNEWRCPKCQDFKQAFKSMSLYKTPKVLIVHLKRFKQKSSYYKSKIGSLVKFPLELNLDGYVINKTLPEAYFKQQNPNVNTRQSTHYELYAVSNHYGGMGGGHYTAYAKNNGDWYDFNDSSVHKIKASEVVSSAAYMLFYKRID